MINSLPTLAELSYFRISCASHDQGLVADYTQDPRPFYSFGFILEGEGDFVTEERTVSVTSGDVIVVPFGCRYYSTWRAPQGSRYVSMHFFFQSRAPFGHGKRLDLQKVTPSAQELYRGAFSEAQKTFFEGDVGKLAALGCFFRILADIMPRLTFSQSQGYDERLAHVAAYLEAHCTEHIRAEELAALCYMSQSHFYARFHQVYGMTPIAYKNKICVHRAMRLLSQPNVSVEAVSQDLGFESTSYFRRVFRKFAGCAPAEYAKRQHGI